METITAVKKHIVPHMSLWVALEGTTRLYLTKVVDVYKDSFTVYPPMDDGETLSVTKKNILEFIYTTNRGKYYFTSSALGIVKDQVTLLALKLPEKIERREKRAYFRVDLLRHVPVKFREDLDTHDGKYFLKGEMVTMVCTDISGGGMKLLSPVELRVNDKLDIELGGIVEGIGEVEGTVVRKIGEEDGAYAFGIMFTSLSEPDRDKIVKRIFQRQTEQARLND